MEKTELRRMMRQARDELSLETQIALAGAMQATLRSWDIYQQCTMLCAFVSTRSEPDTMPVLLQALADGKQLAVPRCLSRQRMAFYHITDLETQLEPGAYGISEPRKDCQQVQQFPAGTVCLVPGLAFDRTGGRLGYGAGYYDRFLQQHPDLVTAGFCSSRSIVERVPVETSDQSVQYLITEHKVEVVHGI